MIHTTRVSYVPAIDGDAAVLAKIQVPVEYQASTASPRCVALLNGAGQPYRLVMTRGEVEFFALCERLDWLDFENRGAAFGLDAVFAR